MTLSRHELAVALAVSCRVWVRKAQEAGNSNVITELLIAEMATQRDIDGSKFSVRYVMQLIRQQCKEHGEMHLLEQKPKWTQKQRDIAADVRIHAQVHYEEDGWDYVVEAYTDDELLELTKHCSTVQNAIIRVHKVVKVRDEVRKDVIGWGGEA